MSYMGDKQARLRQTIWFEGFGRYMNSFLRLAIQHDLDGTCELFGEVSHRGFSGRSSAWFNPDHVLEFAASLSSYPLPSEGVAPLEGGYWSKQGPSRLEQVHLSVCFRPVGQRGSVTCHVRLQAAPDSTDDSPSRNLASVEFATTYQQLAEFAVSVRELVSGRAEEATINDRGST